MVRKPETVHPAASKEMSAADTPDAFPVEVCCAWPDAVERAVVAAQSGWTIAHVVEASGLPRRMAFDPARHRVGIYGKLKTLTTLVRPGDRIEIYRPLLVDPKDARRRRAEKRGREKAQPKARRRPVERA